MLYLKHLSYIPEDIRIIHTFVCYMYSAFHATCHILEIEFGKRAGLEIEMKGNALFWIVAFLSGVTVGVYLEAKNDMLKKKIQNEQ